MRVIDKECLRDYGVTADPQGFRIFQKRIKSPNPICNKSDYVRACRDLAFHRPQDFPDLPAPLEGDQRIDGRLVAMGFNYMGPRRWLQKGLPDFFRYWIRVAPYPNYINSPRNPALEQAFRGMVLHVHPKALNKLPLSMLGGRNFDFGTKGQRPRWWYRRVKRAARAQSRTSMKNAPPGAFTSSALVALGRLCPELQRVALELLPTFPWKPLTAKDIPWKEIAEVQSQMLREPRVRVAWALGRRQEMLLRKLTDKTLEEFLAPGHVGISREAAILIGKEAGRKNLWEMI